MAFRLLVKNIANSWSTGDIIDIRPITSLFGGCESKIQFMNSGKKASDWPRQFVIVNVLDADINDYLFLLDFNSDGPRYFLTPQGSDSPFYSDLIKYAEVTTEKSILDLLINDRGE